MNQICQKSLGNNFMQWIATLSVFMLSTQMGIYNGWTSPNTARLLSEESPIPSTPSDISWLVSLSPIGSFLGAILGSILVECIGSRKTVLVTYSFWGFSWICVLSANSIEWLYAARFIGGSSTTMHYCCFSIYLSEISAPEIRGTLVSLAVIGLAFGNLFGVVAETYLVQTLSTLIYLSIVLIGMSLILYLRDTPYYFVKNNNVENAKQSIMFYRRHIKIEEELKEIINFVEICDSGIKDKLLQLRVPAMKRAVLIIIIAFALPEASGVLTIMSYTEVILNTSGFNLVQPEQWVIYSYVILVIFSLLTIKMLDRLGRRLSFAISSVGTTVAMTALGLHFYLFKSGLDVQSFQWLSVSSLLIYFIIYIIGYGTVPSTLLSEIFPQNIKGIASCLGSLSMSFFGFIFLKAFQPMVDLLGEACVFWIHAFLSALGVPCALFLLLETKGKTFQQMNYKINEKKKTVNISNKEPLLYNNTNLAE